MLTVFQLVTGLVLYYAWGAGLGVPKQLNEPFIVGICVTGVSALVCLGIAHDMED